MSSTDPGRAALDLASALIAIDSVSPSLIPGARGERPIAEFLADRLGSAGFAVELVPAPSDPRRVSVLAIRSGKGSGSASGRTVVLNGHVDTVGVEGMTDPFTPRIDGDRLHGRGSSDMKSGVAGLVVAAERLAAADPPGTIAVALVADEEDASLGAETVLRELAGRELSMDLCLIAEPTWLELTAAQRGYAVVEVGLRGRAAHSSQPEEGVDALRAMGALLAAIEREDAGLRARPAHPSISHGSLMATVAQAGTAPFVVPATARVVVERRTLPGEPSADALEEVRALTAPIAAAHPGLEVDVALTIARDPWELDAAGVAAEFADLLTTALASTGPEPARTGAPYWMESALWQAAGVPTVVCGPAGGGLHAIDEWVDIPQLLRFPGAVTEAVGRFLRAS